MHLDLQSNSPGGFHPEALTEPCLNLSIHTALPSHAFVTRERKPSLEEEAHPGCPVGPALRRAMSSLSLHARYRRFNATTGRSAPRSGIGILPRDACHLSFPFASRAKFSRSIPKPVSSSCRLYTGCRQDRKQVPSWLILEHLHGSSFDSVLGNFRCVIGRFAFAHLLDTHLTSFRCLFHGRSPPRLFKRSSTGRFEANSCKPAPGGPLPSSVQHQKPSFLFVTHCRSFPAAGA